MQVVAFVTVVFCLLAMVVFLFIKWQRAVKGNQEDNKKFEQLQKQVNSLQLETLESRLNPHLFKNILNSIQSHAYQTYYALDKLGNVLDFILYESRKKSVTPQQEIAFALDLIEINRTKVSPLFELKVKTIIREDDPYYLEPIMAPLVTVDLIENAFKHADLQSQDGFISIEFEFKSGLFILTVSNKISGSSVLVKEYGGFGIQSLEKRLKLIYGHNFELQRFVERDVYIARLIINLLEYKAEMHIAG